MSNKIEKAKGLSERNSSQSVVHPVVINSTSQQRILFGLRMSEAYFLGFIPNTKYKDEFVEIAGKLAGQLGQRERSLLLVEYEFLMEKIIDEKVEERKNL